LKKKRRILKFFSSMMRRNNINDRNFADALAAKCSGLIFVSEIDAPVEVVFGKTTKDNSNAPILSSVEPFGNKKINEVSFERFFSRLMSHKEWHTPEQAINAQRFLELKMFLESELQGLNVFRVGEINIEIYILGIDRNGRVVGVRTHAVET